MAVTINPLHSTGHFLYQLKISENQRFSVGMKKSSGIKWVSANVIHTWWINGLVVKALVSWSRGAKSLDGSRVDSVFNLPRSIKWVPETPGDIVVQRNCLLLLALEPWNSWFPSIKRAHKIFLKYLNLWSSVFLVLLPLKMFSVIYAEISSKMKISLAWGKWLTVCLTETFSIT